ncbi:MAG: hypothetical protein WC919_06140 [Candidatus Paceibacterota bacterium]
MNQIEAEKILPDLQEVRSRVADILLQLGIEAPECLNPVVVSTFSCLDV